MLKRILIALPVVLIGWIAILALVMRLGGEAPAAFVPFPPAGLISALPENVTITGRSPISLTLRSEADNLPAQLYEAGAYLVLPAGLEACIPRFLRDDIRRNE
ncbi:hypothetical protein [Gymnodinialimonas hymeniacidonis]|uniref:hypothetical protein n=1 Tax=Gymnodinialimonas hymeniacidonis TaxID=3126508 RepID=UPI0034C6BF57